MSMIIEAADNLEMHTVVTVKTQRGEEYRIDSDAAIEALARLFSDYDNEKRAGWHLSGPWFEQELTKLRTAAFVR